MKAGTIEIELLANMARLVKDMDQAKRAVGDAMGHIERTVGMATKALGVFAGALSVGALIAFVKGAIDAADGINKLSQRTGIAAESLSQLQYAAKLADVSTDSLATGLKKLNVSIAQGIAGDKEKVHWFKQLGITLTDASGRAKTADKVLLEMADAFAKSRDGAGKTAVAVGLLGKAGDEMIPLLNGGGQALRDLMKQADKLGLTISGEFAERAEEFNDNITRMKTGSEKLAIALASDMIDSLGRAAKAMADAALEGSKLHAIWVGLRTLFTGDAQHKANVALVDKMDEIFKMQDAIDKARARGDDATARRRESLLAGLQREYDAQLRVVKGFEAEQAAAREAAAAAKQAREAGSELKEQQAAAAAAAAKAAQELERQRRVTFELAGVNGDYVQQLQDLQKQRVALNMSDERYVELVEALIKKQPGVKAFYDAREKADKAHLDMIEEINRAERGVAERDQQIQDAAAARRHEQQRSAEDLRDAIRFEAEALGMTNVARETAMALRDLERTGLDKSSDAYRRLGQEIREAVANRETLREQQAFWQSIESTAHGVWTTIRERGEGMWKRLRKTAESVFFDWLWQMMGRRWLINVGVNLGVPGASLASQTLSGAPGIGNLLSGAGSMADSVLGLFGGGSGIAGAAITGAEISATVGATGEALLAAGASFTEATAAAAALGESMVATSGALGSIGSALAAIPGWGWAAMAALAIFGLSDSGGGPKTEGVFGRIDDKGIGIGGTSSALNQVAQTAALGIQAQFDSLTQVLGLAVNDIKFGLGISTDPAGDSPSFIDITASRGGETAFSMINHNVGRDQKDIEAALVQMSSQAVIGALKALGDQLPAAVDKALGSGSSAQDTVATITQMANAVAAFGQVAQALPFEELRDLSFDASVALMEANGGLQAITGNLNAYYENFFTEEEKRLNVARQIQDVLSGAGLTVGLEQILGATREQFRQLVETVDTGSPLWNALMSVNGAFASIVPVAGQVAEAAAAMADAAARLQREIDAKLLFLTPQETLKHKAGTIATLFNNATGANITPGFVLGLSPAEFRAYFEQFAGEGNDVVTGAMLELAQSFMELRSGVDAAAKDVAQFKVATAAAMQRGLELGVLRAQEQLDALAAVERESRSSYEAMRAEVDRNVQSLRDMADGLREMREQLDIGPSGGLGGATQYAAAKRALEGANTENIHELTRIFLDAAQGQAASSIAYRRDVAFTKSIIAALEQSQLGSAHAMQLAPYAPSPEHQFQQLLAEYSMAIAQNNLAGGSAQGLMLTQQKFVERYGRSWDEFMWQADAMGNLGTSEQFVKFLLGMPSYDVGTGWVPETGLAMVHQGEHILTRSENERLVPALDAMARRLDAIERNTYEGAREGKLLRGEVEDVTKGRKSMRTRTAAEFTG